MKKLLTACMVFVLVCALLTSCSSSDSLKSMNSNSVDQSDSGMNQDANEGIAGNQEYNDSQVPGEYEEDAAEAEDLETDDGGDGDTGSTGADSAQGSETSQQTKAQKKEEKLVYTCELSIETTTYKETMEEIEKQISKYSGIIESQNEYDNDSGWYRSDYQKTSGTKEAAIVVRIPSEKYQDFLKSLDGTGKMTNKSMDVTNITRTYYDTQAAIKALQIQEKRLLNMMEEANTIEDMITVEKRLTEVQTQLNQYENALSSMDTEVAYSTVTMNISEVMEYKEGTPGRKTNTFKERLQNTLEDSWSGFLSFMEGLLFFLIALLPYGVIAAILWLITRPLRKKLKARRQEKKMSKGSEIKKTGKKKES